MLAFNYPQRPSEFSEFIVAGASPDLADDSNIKAHRPGNQGVTIRVDVEVRYT